MLASLQDKHVRRQAVSTIINRIAPGLLDKSRRIPLAKLYITNEQADSFFHTVDILFKNEKKLPEIREFFATYFEAIPADEVKQTAIDVIQFFDPEDFSAQSIDKLKRLAKFFFALPADVDLTSELSGALLTYYEIFKIHQASETLTGDKYLNLIDEQITAFKQIRIDEAKKASNNQLITRTQETLNALAEQYTSIEGLASIIMTISGELDGFKDTTGDLPWIKVMTETLTSTCQTHHQYAQLLAKAKNDAVNTNLKLRMDILLHALTKVSGENAGTDGALQDFTRALRNQLDLLQRLPVIDDTTSEALIDLITEFTCLFSTRDIEVQYVEECEVTSFADIVRDYICTIFPLLLRCHAIMQPADDSKASEKSEMADEIRSLANSLFNNRIKVVTDPDKLYDAKVRADHKKMQVDRLKHFLHLHDTDKLKALITQRENFKLSQLKALNEKYKSIAPKSLLELYEVLQEFFNFARYDNDYYTLLQAAKLDSTFLNQQGYLQLLERTEFLLEWLDKHQTPTHFHQLPNLRNEVYEELKDAWDALNATVRTLLQVSDALALATGIMAREFHKDREYHSKAWFAAMDQLAELVTPQLDAEALKDKMDMTPSSGLNFDCAFSEFSLELGDNIDDFGADLGDQLDDLLGMLDDFNFDISSPSSSSMTAAARQREAAKKERERQAAERERKSEAKEQQRRRKALEDVRTRQCYSTYLRLNKMEALIEEQREALEKHRKILTKPAASVTSSALPQQSATLTQDHHIVTSNGKLVVNQYALPASMPSAQPETSLQSTASSAHESSPSPANIEVFTFFVEPTDQEMMIPGNFPLERLLRDGIPINIIPYDFQKIKHQASLVSGRCDEYLLPPGGVPISGSIVVSVVTTTPGQEFNVRVPLAEIVKHKIGLSAKVSSRELFDELRASKDLTPKRSSPAASTLTTPSCSNVGGVGPQPHASSWKVSANTRPVHLPPMPAAGQTVCINAVDSARDPEMMLCENIYRTKAVRYGIAINITSSDFQKIKYQASLVSGQCDEHLLAPGSIPESGSIVVTVLAEEEFSIRVPLSAIIKHKVGLMASVSKAQFDQLIAPENHSTAGKHQLASPSVTAPKSTQFGAAGSNTSVPSRPSTLHQSSLSPSSSTPQRAPTNTAPGNASFAAPSTSTANPSSRSGNANSKIGDGNEKSQSKQCLIS